MPERSKRKSTQRVFTTGSQFWKWVLSRISQSHVEMAIAWATCSNFQFPGLSPTLWNLNPMGVAWGLWAWGTKGIPQIRKPRPPWGQGVENTGELWRFCELWRTQGQHLPLSHNNPGAWRVLKELSRGAVQVTHSLGLCDSSLEQYHS